MGRNSFLAIAGIAAMLSVACIIYGVWLQIIQTSGDPAYVWSGRMAMVAIACLVLAFFRRKNVSSN